MMTTIKHHPDAATLMSFAAGSLAEPLAAVTAAHVSMCRQCRDDLKAMEMMGGLLLQGQPVAKLNAEAPSPLSTAHDVEAQQPAEQKPTKRCELLPVPVASHYDLSDDEIPWRRLGPGIWHYQLPLSADVEGDLRLLKIDAGRKMPEHGHGGSELTLVLNGSYADETGRYTRGDMQDLDDDVEHQPVADKETGCICLIASERPAHFKGVIYRIAQYWTGM